MTYVRETRTS